MNDIELQEIVQRHDKEFKLVISDNIFKIQEIKVYQNENPVTEPTKRGGVYFADPQETKAQVTILDTNVTKYFSSAMLGPNKSFLDILIEAELSGGKKISLITNLTNSMQNSSKVILYLTVKDVIIKSD